MAYACLLVCLRYMGKKRIVCRAYAMDYRDTLPCPKKLNLLEEANKSPDF